MFNNIKLNIARKLIASFLVNVYEHPEKVTTYKNGSEFCDQNYLVARAFDSIDELKRLLRNE